MTPPPPWCLSLFFNQGAGAETGTHDAAGTSHGSQPPWPSGLQTAGQAHAITMHWPSNEQVLRSRLEQSVTGAGTHITEGDAQGGQKPSGVHRHSGPGISTH